MHFSTPSPSILLPVPARYISHHAPQKLGLIPQNKEYSKIYQEFEPFVLPLVGKKSKLE